ncbi:sphingosine kinase 1-like [Lampris incognitus]|uniref:sphingosine kinase 1-like n=1 Tax=Lampris incognitus TaxID=2546036 RepID=UPI0024B531A7|nr:sphingosine kinase 1-like [Lampris incognitus]
MDGGKVEVDLRSRSDFNHVALYGEFAASGSRQVRYAVSLTERDLTVRRVSSSSAPVGRSKLVLSLKDCIGSRAARGEGGGDAAALLSAFFYPLRKRRMGSGVSRHRVEQSFRVAPGQDPCANLAEAEKWARAIRERSARQQHWRNGGSFSEVHRPCRMMLLVNPQSGKGQALSLYNSHIQRMLNEAGVPHTLVITERQNHARELVREADLSKWDALVIMSGDGLLFEVINGLLERSDWEEAIDTPLGILPGGSGNALAASIHHYSGAIPVSSEELLVSCGFLLCKGLVSRMSLVSVHLPSSPRLFSFLSLAWGFVADVDVESEKYRHVGAARFTVGTLVRLASLRVYRGKLAYLPGGRRESATSRNVTNTPIGPVDSLLPPLGQPLPSDWVVVQEEDFVLMLAMYQSHLAEDLFAAPNAALDDGVIHLFYVRAGISRTALLRLFLAMEKGTHLLTDCQHLVYIKVRALRLEPYSSKGVIMVDGEAVEYGPVQAQVHRGLARLISG